MGFRYPLKTAGWLGNMSQLISVNLQLVVHESNEMVVSLLKDFAGEGSISG